MTTIYIMQARENYSPALVAGFNAGSPTAPLYCNAENSEPGLQYDANNREIVYPVTIAATDPQVNTTGHVLWDGINQYANGSNLNGVVLWNLQIGVKNIDTDAVVFNNCFDVGTTVPAGVGAFSTGFIEFSANPTAGQNIVLNGVTWTFVASGASGSQTNIQADMASTIRQLSWDLNNSANGSLSPAFYFSYSLFADSNLFAHMQITYMTSGLGGDGYTLAVGTAGASVSGITLTGGTNAHSDGTWRRTVADTDAYGRDQPLLVDPYTGNAWVHVESCFMYHFRRADNFVQKLSPFRPIYNSNDASYPLGITSTWTYFWERIPYAPASPPTNSFLFLTPRVISSRETALDQLLAYAQFPMPMSATGVMSFGSGNPTNGQTVIFDGVAWTFVTLGASGNQTNIGASLAATLDQLQLDLTASANANIQLAYYSVITGPGATAIDITYKTSGVAGNAYTLGAGTYGASLSASTLTQGVGPTAPSGIGDATFDYVVYSDQSLVFISCTYCGSGNTTAFTKNYAMWRFQPPPIGGNGIPTTGGGFTNITPWTSTTGPNTTTAAYHNSSYFFTGTNQYSQEMIYFLPATNNFVVLTCNFPQQHGLTNSDDPALFFIDCTYVSGLGVSFNYHSAFVTGYMSAAWAPTVLGSAAYAVVSVNETNRFLDTTDYSFAGVDYTNRWFSFSVWDVIGGVVQTGAGKSQRIVFVQYAFVSGSAPTVLHVIDEAGWDAAYSVYGTYLQGITGLSYPNPFSVVLNSSIQGFKYNLYNYDIYNNDSSLYDPQTNSFWLSGQNSYWLGFDPYYTTRSLLNGGCILGPDFAGTGPTPPFMRLSLGSTAPGKGKTYMRLLEKTHRKPKKQRYAVGTAVGAGHAAAASQYGSLAVGTAAGIGTALALGGSTAASVGSAVGIGAASAVAGGAVSAVGTAAGVGAATGAGATASGTTAVGSAAGVGAASAVGSSKALAVGSAVGQGNASGVSQPLVGNLVATITFPGGSPVSGPIVYLMSSGTDIGSYTAPTAGFTQKCVRVRNAALPNYFVDFRPDVSGGRVEVVFWNGEVDPVGLTVASGHIRNLPSYTVTITNGGTTLYSATIPYHYWATRWRYKSTDRPAIRANTQIWNSFFPHMSLTAARLSGNNLSTGKPWSGLPYSSFPVIQPAAPPVVTPTYTPFMPPDTASIGGSPMPSTTLASPASLGATTIVVASAGGFAQDSHIAILLSDGTTFTTRIISVDPQTTTWTLEFALPNSANSGALVYNGEYKLKLYLYIETGGERSELGAMTEWAGDYLLNGTSTSLNAIRQQAEMSCSEWPFFLSDLNTNAPLNFKSDVTHYKVIIGAGDYGGYYRDAYTNQGNGWDFHEQDSHFQMHPYIAWALTEDAYFLEGLQYLQAYGMGCTGTMLGREGNPTSSHGQYGWGDLLGTPAGTGGTNGNFTMCSYYGEIRTVGNGIRNLAMAYKCAPASPPSWLLPQSYYASVSSDYSNVVQTLWTSNGANLHAVFRQLSQDNYWQAFEQAYGIMGMAIADLVGMTTGTNPSWLTQLNFYFGMIAGITNGTSGWNNQTPQPHDIQNNIFPESPAAGALDFSLHNTWASLYAAAAPFVQGGATFPTQASPGNQQGASMGNCNMIFAAAAMAKSRGIFNGINAKAWMDTFIDYNYPNNADASMGIPMEMKCGFDGT